MREYQTLIDAVLDLEELGDEELLSVAYRHIMLFEENNPSIVAKYFENRGQ